MKAIQINSRNSDSEPELIHLPTLTVTEDTLLIAVKASGVNYADFMQKQGLYPSVLPLPYIPGYEVAGEVIAVGDKVEGFAVGDRVASLLPLGGGYAEYALAQAQRCFKLPAGLDYSEATALLTQGLTAFIMVDKFVKPNQKILLTAAAGGVGTLALQLALAKGATVYGSTSTKEKMQLVESLGAIPVNYREDDWIETLHRDNLEFDLLLDAVGGDTLKTAWSLVKPFGDIVSYGNACFEDFRVTADEMFELHFKNQSLNFYGFNKCIERDPSLLMRGLETVISKRMKGELSITLHPSYSLEAVPQMFSDLVNRRTQGKVVIKP